jgi:6-pyruvoyl-tetrahydropterin synthase
MFFDFKKIKVTKINIHKNLDHLNLNQGGKSVSLLPC